MQLGRYANPDTSQCHGDGCKMRNEVTSMTSRPCEDGVLCLVALIHVLLQPSALHRDIWSGNRHYADSKGDHNRYLRRIKNQQSLVVSRLGVLSQKFQRAISWSRDTMTLHSLRHE